MFGVKTPCSAIDIIIVLCNSNLIFMALNLKKICMFPECIMQVALQAQDLITYQLSLGRGVEPHFHKCELLPKSHLVSNILESPITMNVIKIFKESIVPAYLNILLKTNIPKELNHSIQLLSSDDSISLAVWLMYKKLCKWIKFIYSFFNISTFFYDDFRPH